MARWKPPVGRYYFYVDTSIRKVFNYSWADNEVNNWHYAMGNCFPTYEEAERALEMVKELFLSLHEEVKANGTRKDYTDMLKHYATTGAKGVKTETLVKVVELMTKDVIGEQ